MYGSHSPPVTNNPFLSNSAQARFPDINTGADPQSAQWQQQQPSGNYQQQPSWPQQTGFPAPQATGYYPSPQQQQPQQQQYTPQPFQPSSSFGQQLAPQINPTGSYGYLYGQQQNQQPMSPVQQQLQSYSNVAQFDPYASIGQGLWDGPPQQQQQQQQYQQQAMSPAPSTTPGTFNGSEHPREFVRTHKAQLERWDSYTWKQLLSSFDALKQSWESRRVQMDGKVNELGMQMQQMQYSGGGGFYVNQIQQEGSRIQGVRLGFVLSKPALNSLSVTERGGRQSRQVLVIDCTLCETI